MFARVPKVPKSKKTGPDPERRQRIVESAVSLFSRYGFRRTSVDLLAAEAGVAKPTLYAYFDDKEAVFLAVCEHVMDRIVAKAREEAQAPGSIEARVCAVLGAKFTFLFELVDSSPHASEILDSQSRIGADVVQRADRSYHRVLTSLVEEGVANREIDLRPIGATASGFATTLMRCGHGAAYGAESAAAHKRHLAELVKVALAAVR